MADWIPSAEELKTLRKDKLAQQAMRYQAKLRAIEKIVTRAGDWGVRELLVALEEIRKVLES